MFDNTIVPEVVDLQRKNRLYLKYQRQWQFIRDVIEGEEAVKERGTTYLPRPSGQDDEEYESYMERAPFFNGTSRTLDAMVGLVFRKTPTFIASDKVKEYAKHITSQGASLDDFARTVMLEIMTVYRVGILTEYPYVDHDYVTIQEIEDADNRPYLTLYTAEDIYDWRETYVGWRKVLSYVKLHEVVEEPDRNGLGTKDVHRFRIFWINENSECQFALYEIRDSKTVDITPASPFVVIGGKRIGFIPFSFCGPLTSTSMLQKPLLYDLARVNIHHYHAGADRANAIHWADSPTPIFIGSLISKHGGEVNEIKLGSKSALNMQLGGDAKFLEFTGHGIEPTERLMAEYKSDMAMLGSKILSPEQNSAEVAATAAIRRAGENSILAAVAKSLSASITQAVKWLCRFAGMEDGIEDISYRLNTDFYPTPMDSQTIIALIGAVQARKISDEEFFEALVEGEVIRSDKIYEDHKKEIDAMPEVAPVVAASGGAFGQPAAGVRKAGSEPVAPARKVDGVVDQGRK